MTKFTANVQYGPLTVRIEADTLEELHQAAARMQELNTDADWLEKKTGTKIALRFYIDKEGNDYYGFREEAGHRNVTFGRYREKQAVPFFPKREEGYYDGDTVGGAAKADTPTRRTASPAPPLPPIEAYG